MIVMTAKLRVNEGSADAFIEAGKKMVAAVKENESGVLSYDLYRSNSDPNLFMFIERYAGEEALAAHRTTPHMAEFGGVIRGLLAGRLEIERFEPVD
jgi:quinol monooxygenase YgiN